jgi:hypothetical protein
MYNGQFVKGLVHVFVFALLCSFSAHESFFGILIPFWIAYQVFDAYQTARARRDGTPMPNPFGLNDLGYRLGLQQHPEGTVIPPSPGVPVPPPYAPPGSTSGPAAPFTAPFTPPYAPHYGAGPEPPSTDWTAYVPRDPGTGYAAGFGPGPTPGNIGAPPPYAPGPMSPFGSTHRNDIPTGAIVLIGLGVLFLLGSLGIFHDEWIGRGWPLLIVGIGVWLVVRRAREPRGYAPAQPPVQPPDRNSL